MFAAILTVTREGLISRVRTMVLSHLDDLASVCRRNAGIRWTIGVIFQFWAYR